MKKAVTMIVVAAAFFSFAVAYGVRAAKENTQKDCTMQHLPIVYVDVVSADVDLVKARQVFETQINNVLDISKKYNIGSVTLKSVDYDVESVGKGKSSLYHIDGVAAYKVDDVRQADTLLMQLKQQELGASMQVKTKLPRGC